MCIRDSDRLDHRGVQGRPELAVEILSPSTQRVDRTLKLERYQRAGTPAYWLADPKALTLTAYEPVSYTHLDVYKRQRKDTDARRGHQPR